MGDYPTLAEPLMRDVGLITERPPSPALGAPPIAGVELVSADNHWEVTENIFVENFPAHLKDRAPKVWFDEIWQIGNPEAGIFAFPPVVRKAVQRAVMQAAFTWETRKAHLAADGLGQEIVFPQSLLGATSRDPEVREWTFRIYNDYVAAQCRADPDFHGVGIFSNWWDADKVEAAMRQVLDLGLKTFMVPTSLRGADGKEMSFADPALDRFWAVANEAGLPVCLHIGEPEDLSGRGSHATIGMMTIASFRRPLSQLVFGGVFDRNPDLQVVFAEGGLGWVLTWLQDAEMRWDSRGSMLDRMAHRPSHYWRTHCYATFQFDALGLRNLDLLGADRVMWGADYPHSEGAFGLTQKAVRSMVADVGEPAGKLIFSENAKRVFKL